MALGDPASESLPRHPPPPLRIHHLLACAVAAAAYLAYWRATLPADVVERISNTGAAPIALFAVSQVVNVIGVTLGVFSVYWHLKGFAALVQPGQWLLFSGFLSIIRWLTLRLFGSRFWTSPWDKNLLLWNLNDLAYAATYLFALVAYAGLPILFFAWCAWRVADTRVWRVLFSLMAIGYLIVILPLLRMVISQQWFGPPGTLFVVPMAIASVCKLVLGAWAPLNDYFRGIGRAWTHWAGSGLFITGEVIGVIMSGFVYFRWL